MNWASIDSFLRQKTTILGVATLIGTGISIATGELTWALGVPLIAGAVVAIAVPEKPQAVADVQQAVADGIAVAMAPTPGAGAKIAGDLVKLAGDFPASQPVVAVQPAAPVPVQPYVVSPAAPAAIVGSLTASGAVNVAEAMKLPTA